MADQITWIDWVTMGLAGASLGLPLWLQFKAGQPTFLLDVSRSADHADALNIILRVVTPGNKAWSVVGLRVSEPPEMNLRSQYGPTGKFIATDRELVWAETGLIQRIALLSDDRMTPGRRVVLQVQIRSAYGLRCMVAAEGRIPAAAE